MKKSMILNVLKAMNNIGYEVVELDGVIKDLTKSDNIVNVIAEEFERIQVQAKSNLLKAALKDFQATLENVSIIDGKTITVTNSDGEYERPATYEDSVDFILSAWDNMSERLDEELGIDLDEE